MDALANANNADQALDMLRKASVSAPTPYFTGCLIGYVLAIITTVVVMLVFEHGQPALLYLVPGVLGSVALNALIRGDFKKLQDYSEENLVNDNKEKAN